jgi:3-oxoacyl-[acyl-carrier protein] reductase
MSSSRSVLVTGASRGIGRATAIALARRGFFVALNYVSNDAAVAEAKREVESLGTKAVAVRADVSRAGEVAAMFDLVESALGPLDGLVCNAGRTRDTLLGASQPEDF